MRLQGDGLAQRLGRAVISCVSLNLADCQESTYARKDAFCSDVYLCGILKAKTLCNIIDVFHTVIFIVVSRPNTLNLMILPSLYKYPIIWSLIVGLESRFNELMIANSLT